MRLQRDSDLIFIVVEEWFFIEFIDIFYILEILVLDAQRTLIETEQEYVNALVDYHTSKSALERLIAKEL